MTRQECEKKLTDLMEQAYRIFREYAPDGGHLDMFASEDGHCAIGYARRDDKHKIILDGYKSPDGRYRTTKEAKA